MKQKTKHAKQIMNDDKLQKSGNDSMESSIHKMKKESKRGKEIVKDMKDKNK